MKNFNFTPSNIDLYEAICRDYGNAVKSAFKNGSKKVNKREVFIANARVYWSIHRSAKDSWLGFLAIMDEISDNQQKKKQKRLEVRIADEFSKVT